MLVTRLKFCLHTGIVGDKKTSIVNAIEVAIVQHRLHRCWSPTFCEGIC